MSSPAVPLESLATAIAAFMRKHEAVMHGATMVIVTIDVAIGLEMARRSQHPWFEPTDWLSELDQTQPPPPGFLDWIAGWFPLVSLPLESITVAQSCRNYAAAMVAAALGQILRTSPEYHDLVLADQRRPLDRELILARYQPPF